MNAADILRLAAQHGQRVRDMDQPGEVWIWCAAGHKWEGPAVAERYAQEPFGCPFCLGEMPLNRSARASPTSAPSASATSRAPASRG